MILMLLVFLLRGYYQEYLYFFRFFQGKDWELPYLIQGTLALLSLILSGTSISISS